MKNTLYAIFSFFIMICTCQAQTVQEILKNNVSTTCDCIDKIDYIDSKVDIEIKFNKCRELNEKDSFIIQENTTLEKYEELFYKEMSQCKAVDTKIDAFKQGYFTDAINTSNADYQEIEKRILGGYSLSFGRHSPSGGTELVIYNNNRYAVISFGFVIVGTWKVVRENYLHLTPDNKEHLFNVYGRYNPEIGDSTKTAFEGNEFSSSTLIHYGDLDKDVQTLTPIFNNDQNCTSSPFVGKTDNTYDVLSLAYLYDKKEDKNVDIYTFNNKQKFNDFVVYENIRMNDQKEMRVIIDNDTLVFGKDKIAERSDLPKETSENGIFLKGITQLSHIENPKDVYYNASYKQFYGIGKSTLSRIISSIDQEGEIINSELYNFNKSLNTYVSTEECSENCTKEDDYDYSMRVNKYELLEDVHLTQRPIMIADKPIIYSVCDNHYGL